MESSTTTFAEEKLTFYERCFQKRYILAGMGFWCFFVLSSLRLNISIGIVAMVNWTEVQKEQGIDPNISEACHFPSTEERSKREDGPFLWAPETQGFILGCYFYGLASTQLLGGRLSEAFSAKFVLFWGTLLASTCTLLTPVSSTDSGTGIMVLQIFKGCGQGIMMPAFSVLIGKWIPPIERARFTSFIVCGLSVGGFFTVILSGYICKIQSLGWSYVFYIFGAQAAAWCALWLILVHDSPLNHPNISRWELNRIMSLRSQKAPQLHHPVPIKAIFNSKPVWAYILVGFASFWCLSLYVSVFPLFMGTILKFDIEKNGAMSALPNLLQAFFLILTSQISDLLLMKKVLHVTTVRKIFISIGLCGFAVCITIVTFTGCNRTLSVFFFVTALGMSGFNFAASAVVPVDMSPRFAGTVSGIMNTFGAMSGVIIPSAIGYLTKERQTINEWSILFYASATICIFAVIIFISFGSSEVQPWNNPPVEASVSEDALEEERIRRVSFAAPSQSGSEAVLQGGSPTTEPSTGEIPSSTATDRPWRDPSFPDEPEERRPSVIVHYY